MSLRASLVSTIVIGCLSLVACGGGPPEKEIKQAQDAVAAAKSANADVYAATELTAAEDALKRANDAVGQRDYRLALNHALDSLERAQTALTQANSARTAAGEEARRIVAAATSALNAAAAKLKELEAAHTPPRSLASAREAIAIAENSLQEARTAFDAGNFQRAANAAGNALQPLMEATSELDEAAAPQTRRRR